MHTLYSRGAGARYERMSVYRASVPVIPKAFRRVRAGRVQQELRTPTHHSRLPSVVLYTHTPIRTLFATYRNPYRLSPFESLPIYTHV